MLTQIPFGILIVLSEHSIQTMSPVPRMRRPEYIDVGVLNIKWTNELCNQQ
jgi:hypothetical protein